LVRVRPRKKIIQISHTCRAEDAEANPREKWWDPRKLRSARRSDRTTGQTRTEYVDLELRKSNQIRTYANLYINPSSPFKVLLLTLDGFHL
jgi:hypothetical protein